MRLPRNNRWTQTNEGNITGFLHDTHNINFSLTGEARLSQKAGAVMSDATDADFGEVMAIQYFNGNYFIATDGKAFAGDLSGTAFTEIASSPSLSVSTDAVVFNSKIYVTTSTSLSSWTGSTWANSLDTYTTGYPHPMAIFESQPTYKLAVGNAHQVETLDTSHNPNSTVLSLPQRYVITSLAYRNGYLFIGTKEINGGEASVFLWNGDGTNAQYKIDVGASWVYSLVPYRGSVACITNEGELLYINGTGVERLAALPVYYAPGIRWEMGTAVRGKVYPRGMAVQGDNIYININGDCEGGFIPEMRSGVWCYDPAVGLYHMATASTDLWVADSAFSLSGSTITASATHNIQLGDPVMFSAVSGITGISSNVIYYAIPATTTTLRIAATRYDAFNGNRIALSGSRTTDTLHYFPNTDYGYAYASAGAIAITNYLDNGKFEIFSSDILFGAETKTPGGTTRDVLCVFNGGKNVGHLSTQRIYTDNVTQTWKSAYTFLHGIEGLREHGYVKALTAPRLSLPSRPISGTWSDTTTFVTTDYYVRNILQVLDEIQILDGYGQGLTAHVTAISQSDTTTTITIDQSVGTAGGTLSFIFTPFKLIHAIEYDRPDMNVARATLDMKSNWVQLAYELQGFETSISVIELTHSADKSAV